MNRVIGGNPARQISDGDSLLDSWASDVTETAKAAIRNTMRISFVCILGNSIHRSYTILIRQKKVLTISLERTIHLFPHFFTTEAQRARSFTEVHFEVL